MKKLLGMLALLLMLAGCREPVVYECERCFHFGPGSLRCSAANTATIQSMLLQARLTDERCAGAEPTTGEAGCPGPEESEAPRSEAPERREREEGSGTWSPGFR